MLFKKYIILLKMFVKKYIILLKILKCVKKIYNYIENVIICQKLQNFIKNVSQK